MADDNKPEAEADAPLPRTPPDQAVARAANEAPAPRRLPAPRSLTRTELEVLRSRLQRKFH